MLTESKNPITEAEESGLMVYTTDDAPVYLLIQLTEKDESLNIQLNSEGMSREQSLSVLKAVQEMIKADLSKASLDISTQDS